MTVYVSRCKADFHEQWSGRHEEVVRRTMDSVKSTSGRRWLRGHTDIVHIGLRPLWCSG